MAGIMQLLMASGQAFDATGGTITYADGYKIHTFTESGQFFEPNMDGEVEYLVVAGGGGGGAGGGGAGGFLEGVGFTVHAQVYPITVGDRGVGSTSTTPATSGQNSVFSTIVAIGGGHGSGYAGTDGGSGGGGARDNPGGIGVVGQGHDGGFGATYDFAGGGGAETVGGASGNGVAGDGGRGKSSSISGTAKRYAAGGGGASISGTAGNGGDGGGGHGGVGSSNIGLTNAEVNTGSGGGGGITIGGNGAKGVIVIRYKHNN